MSEQFAGWSRRDALKLAGVAAGGVVLGGAAAASPAVASPAGGTAAKQSAAAPRPARADSIDLPVERIEAIIGAQGMVSDGVLNIEIDRDDIDGVRNSFGVPIKPSFQINGNIVFQPHGDGNAVLNADLPFRPGETQGALDRMLASNIVFQAFHQHFYDWDPMVWFMHFRGKGDPLRLARGVRAILNATSTPLPQSPPPNPTTPLDVQRLARILRAPGTVGADGVVTFDVPRKNTIVLDGVPINPDLNVSHVVAFEPLPDRTAVVVDFSMVADEVQPVVELMRLLHWQVGCLYNQETDEHPQLYFSHQFKAGNAYNLAAQVRRGIDLTDA